MGAIDNSNMLNYRETTGTTGFVPSVAYAYDAVDKEVDITNNSTYPAGVNLDIVHVRVHDRFGKEAYGSIQPGVGSGADGNITIDVADLDASKGLSITATVVAKDGKLVADGSAHNILAAGSLSGWDKQLNA